MDLTPRPSSPRTARAQLGYVRCLAVLGAVVLAAATPALADNIGDKKQHVDAKIGSLQARIAVAQKLEGALRGQIAAVTGQIRALDGQVVDVSARLDILQRDLALRQARLDKLNALYALQTRKYLFEREQYKLALARLNARLVAIYMSDDPTVLDVVLNAKSVSDALDQVDYLSAISRQDQEIAVAVAVAEKSARRQQLETATVKTQVRSEVQAVAVRTYQQGAVKARLLGLHGKLATARSASNGRLVAIQTNQREWVQEANALQATSQSLAAQIQAAEAARRSASAPPPSSVTPAAAPVAGGLIWPVQGPVTSPFGMRWGSLHPGLDIGVGFGTPIHAAAAGTVLVAAYSGGYGNLVVIDHGNGIATAYAHQEPMATSVGQRVNQGDVIGYVGSTGFSTGPHLHFEVRINGEPVDPLGYL